MLFGASLARAQQFHVVEAGEVLSRIAEAKGVSVAELREWNALASDRIVVGQRLVVRPARAPGDGTENADEVGVASSESARAAEASASPAESREPRERARPARPFTGLTHRVARGETMSAVAARYGVSLADLRALNGDLDMNRVRVGTRVRVRREAGREATYTVARGDTLSRIAQEFEVSVADLRRWNPRVRRGLLAGTHLRVYTSVPESRSESVGAPNRGTLTNAVRLGPHPAYTIRNPALAFGTLETVRWTRAAFDEVRRRHGVRRRIEVHDLSRRRGGFLRGHRSHQSGRDIDLAYFHRRGDGPCDFRRIRAEDLDAERQWTLFHHWLANDQIDAIFMDYSLQRPLYEEARRRGATRAQLSRWFQYPHGRTSRLGKIRHYPKHRDHIHVRFVCHESDETCRRSVPRRRARGARRSRRGRARHSH
ncbi:MAG: penicillin-insensitive murein endopeptidase [Myxococcota bacterium]